MRLTKTYYIERGEQEIEVKVEAEVEADDIANAWSTRFIYDVSDIEIKVLANNPLTNDEILFIEDKAKNDSWEEEMADVAAIDYDKYLDLDKITDLT